MLRTEDIDPSYDNRMFIYILFMDEAVYSRVLPVRNKIKVLNEVFLMVALSLEEVENMTW